jgi:hypothetical protein
METFYELCESQLRKGIGEEISGEWKDEEKKNIYDASWNEEVGLFGEEMKLSFQISR